MSRREGRRTARAGVAGDCAFVATIDVEDNVLEANAALGLQLLVDSFR